ncbi:MAG: hypothetical protein IPO83_00200 [Chitinophagaceae bacterium]|nr:hypothetical protein [Chitinophagaceae bacterium]
MKSPFTGVKNFLIALLIVSSVFMNNKASAQQQNITMVNYSMSLGMGNTGDFISQYSFRGFDVQYRHMQTLNIGVGFNTGWNVFYQHLPDASFTYETATLTGDQWRYFNSIPILVMADYFFKPGVNEKINPYIGGGLGVEYASATVNFGVFSAQKDSWPFVLSPEIGVLIHPSITGPAINLGIRYMYGFKTDDLPSDSHILFNVGFAFSN